MKGIGYKRVYFIINRGEGSFEYVGLNDRQFFIEIDVFQMDISYLKLNCNCFSYCSRG